jgi:anti-sigma B factor antagonist
MAVVGTSRDDDTASVGSVSLQVSEVTTRLVFRGEVDIAMNRHLTSVVEELLELGAPLEVHTGEVTYMDSAAIASLALLATGLPNRVRVIDPPALVRFLLEVTQLNELVDIVDTRPSIGAVGREGERDRPGQNGHGSHDGHAVSGELRTRSARCQCSACAGRRANEQN